MIFKYNQNEQHKESWIASDSKNIVMDIWVSWIVMYWEMIWMYCQEYLTYDIVWQATTVEIDLIRSPKNEYIMN